MPVSPETDLAVRFMAPQVAQLVERPLDGRPLGATEVAGRTVVSLISPGTELAGYQGLWSWTTLPTDTGYAAVFAVERVGAEVKDLRAGDLALCMGGHRLHQRHERQSVVPLPAGLAPEAGVFARLMGVTMASLVTTTARPPDVVVVTGLGLVGNLGAQIFRSCGYSVIGCDPVASKRALAQRCGIADVRERVPVDDARLVERVALVLECSGHEQAALDGCRMARKGGEVSLVGVPWKRRADLQAFDVMHAVFHRYVTLRSGWEWAMPGQPTEFRSGSVFGNFAGALEWLRDRRINVDALAATFSPRQAQPAYQSLLTGAQERLTVLFDWRQV
jgi:threonine dehydrogenase-like Zn-dependent dehydrogenase